jgi:hypothetical protein
MKRKKLIHLVLAKMLLLLSRLKLCKRCMVILENSEIPAHNLEFWNTLYMNFDENIFIKSNSVNSASKKLDTSVLTHC